MSEISKIVSETSKIFLNRKLNFSCAESCTGGLISKYCTDLEGSSSWFDRAFITYSNESKVEMIGVSAKTIKQYGAVSKEVAKQMVLGVIAKSHSQVAVAVTGIAGPSGGSEEKPIGTVWFGFSILGQLDTQLCLFKGNREKVREQAVAFVFEYLVKKLKAQ